MSVYSFKFVEMHLSVEAEMWTLPSTEIGVEDLKGFFSCSRILTYNLEILMAMRIHKQDLVGDYALFISWLDEGYVTKGKAASAISGIV